MAKPQKNYSSLVTFFNNIIGRRNGTIAPGGDGAIQDGKTTIDPSADFVSWEDFPELAINFYQYFPDPDEVLLKLGQSAGVYREMLTDAHIGGALLQRKSKTKQKAIVFIAGDQTPQADEARALCERQLRAIPRLRNVVSEILNAPFYGASYLELFFDRLPPEGDVRPAGEVVLKNIKEKPFEWFAWDKDGNLGLRDMIASTFYIRPLPEWKFVPVVYEGSYANPYGDKICKRVYWPWLFKKGGLRFWAEFIEKYGMPFLYGQVDPKKSNEDVAKFHDDLYNMARNGVLVARSDSTSDKVTVIEAGGKSSSNDAYSKYKNALNIEISKAILGETLTIENSESGSQAATSVHADALDDVQDEDKVLVETALSEICRRLTAYNFPPEVPAPKVALIDLKELNAEVAGRDAILSDKLGVRFKKSYVSRVYSVPDEDFEIKEPAAQASPFGGGFPGPGAGGKDDGPALPGKNAPGAGTSGAQGDGTVDESGSDDIAPENAGDGKAFAEANKFEVQKGIDQYVESVIGNITGLTAPLRIEIATAIQSSKSYDEMISKIVLIKDRVDQGKFSEVFGAALNTISVLGLYAAERGRI